MSHQEFYHAESLKGILEQKRVQRALIFTGSPTFARYKEHILPLITCPFDVCATCNHQ